ncbi:hypothetical protein NQ317_015453 [Molorchus minor]|uniref:Uncharacterized protein n=1 Tax=Molorchus minor TaxID=1323400 RepID=A0ABQ9JVM4_9CUCU|nr:hypothetical protein NQ317_015453 [Molorchus minor]
MARERGKVTDAAPVAVTSCTPTPKTLTDAHQAASPCRTPAVAEHDSHKSPLRRRTTERQPR